MSQRTVFLLRHGATDMSETGAFVGRADPRLNHRGELQAAAWQPLASSGLVGRTVHSPLRRAAQTAAVAGFTPTETSELLREWDLGDLEGANADEFRRANPTWSLFVDGPPNGSGERPAEVVDRARDVISAFLGTEDADGVLVLVAHGQFLRVLALTLLGLPVRHASSFALGPARAAIISVRGSGAYALTGWNIAGPAQPLQALAGLT